MGGGPMVRVLSCAIAAVVALSGTAHAADCPTAPDPAKLPDAAGLKKMNAFLGPLGARPTGSPEQQVYIDWIRRELAKIPGVKVSEVGYPINRWSEQSSTLRVRIGGRAAHPPGADPIPYSAPTAQDGGAGRAGLLPHHQADT